ncbi:MAG TPA: NAD(P)-dependent alcohol dehydrogenase [Oligoflexus sp.]|uniref:NAD(P)-dependent alcohol dehydrogenase n=1 Tax=Oligoflexus sp. TaxID=1971216 RepID=UPI002D511F18|nr:NAD(P)-dependent alcohol dehydrogenase [Oligoflexus sp.]HYX37761.1 NAD(P)-dependent alcohol dehydrogenase [Oligoflexus sp.]
MNFSQFQGPVEFGSPRPLPISILRGPDSRRRIRMGALSGDFSLPGKVSFLGLNQVLLLGKACLYFGIDNDNTQGGRWLSQRRKIMKALRFTGWQQPIELMELPIPVPGPGEVLIKVAGSGACHSDLHIMEAPSGKVDWVLPFTLGHENAGWIEQLGPGVKGFGHGEAVIVHGAWGCGNCGRCRIGAENYCENRHTVKAKGGGLGRDGGMSEYMLVPSSRHLVRLGRVDPREAAPLGDAALTPYHAIKGSLGILGPGSSAVVIGVGGLGQMAVQLLKALTVAQVIAVDRSAEKLEQARNLGADATFISDDKTATKILDATGKRGAELVLDVVGATPTLSLAAKVARELGHLTILGLGHGDFQLFSIPKGCQVSTPFWGTITDLIDVVQLAEKKKITLHNEYFSLDRAKDAYERMKEGRLTGRAVITPHG